MATSEQHQSCLEEAEVTSEESEVMAAAENQESLTSTSGSSGGGGYSGLAAKTVENIRRLQENVSTTATSGVAAGQNATSPLAAAAAAAAPAPTLAWVGNHQVPSSSSHPPHSDNNEHLDPSASSPSSSTQNKTGNKTGSNVLRSPPPPPSPLPCISPTLASTFNALVTIDPNWQSSKRSVRERNAVMCNNALMADVYFVVGADLDTSRKFPAHKYVLATGSTVFYAMFFGGLAEVADVIEVPDVEPDAFLAMLRYLYCDEVRLNSDNVLATLYCAKRYIVPHLAQECVKFLESHLTARNACVLLSQSRLFEEPELTQRAWEVIDAQAQSALKAESFTDVDFDTLKAVLARETLNCRETFVFHAALRWSESECRRRGSDSNSMACRREALGSAMHLIRFPAMSVQEFADEVVKSDILSLQETTDIFMHFTAKEKPRVLYPSRPRVGLQMQVCHRFQSSAYRSNQWRYRGRCDAVQFCADRRVFVVGFGLYGSSSGASDYTATIQLKLTADGDAKSGSTKQTSEGDGSSPSSKEKVSERLLAHNVCRFHSDGSSNTFQVFFEQPVQVEPDVFYTASAVLDGAELSYFGQEGVPEVAVPIVTSSSGQMTSSNGQMTSSSEGEVVGAGAVVTFQFQCSAESTNGTGVQGGQIPELLFYGPSDNGGGSGCGTLRRTAAKGNNNSSNNNSQPQEDNGNSHQGD